MAPYAAILSFVQHLTPTWRKPQQVGLARLIGALLERPTLCLSELARALPQPTQPLHGRLKRLMRWLDNPRLDELALTARCLRLSYRLGDDPVDQPGGARGQAGGARPLLAILLDTTSFEPFAALVAAVACGGRALPLALATYHRTSLQAAFPPPERWPVHGQPTAAGPAAARATSFRSQNQIEERLIDLVWQLLCPGLRGVLVADRGFARASLFRGLQRQGRDFVIRIDAATHVALRPAGPSAPAAAALALRPRERRWIVGGAYHKDARVPVNLLAVWEPQQEEPWYLATSLERADWAEQLYRWRMRIECANRDEKTGVLLRQGGDAHGLTSLLHLHRVLLALLVATWLCALSGLQAHRDLAPAAPRPADALPHTPPNAQAAAWLDAGPAPPPPPVPHRGPAPATPPGLRRFTARGSLSYVRLGLEVLRAPDLAWLLRRLVHWLGLYLWSWTPWYRPWQIRYRLAHWWLDST